MASPKLNTGLINFGTILSVAGALTVILSGYGYQWGWWHFGFGFTIIPWGTGATVLGGILAGIGFIRLSPKSQKFVTATSVSVLLMVAALVNIGYWYSEVQKGYPPIHDITTDLENPPAFDAIVPLRADAPNPVEYSGPETAESQRNYYPDIETHYTALSYEEAYTKALETAREMPWKLVGESREEGRIEAYHKLAWFGFIDDVVIRVDTTDSGSKIDIRSKSRIGRGDLGVNAKRIRSYLQEFEN